MSPDSSVVGQGRLPILAALLGVVTLLGGVVSFCGWMLDIPRLTFWLERSIYIQPNTAVLIICTGLAVALTHTGYHRCAQGLGGFVAFAGALNLMQYIANTDFGFNHQLLFGRTWGYEATVSPGRFGPPASVSFIALGVSLVLLNSRSPALIRFVPALALSVALLMLFSLMGYLFGARSFYAIPWLSAIAFPSAVMLMTLSVCVLISAPQHQPMLLLCERSSAGSMARMVLPVLVTMIPLLIWLRVKGYEQGLFDLGTSRALGAVALMLAVVALMWNALLALRRREQREREADRHKDEFLATLAHELRNPLAPISNGVSLLKLAGDNPEACKRATDMIERQTAHLVRLVDDLLDLSRISSGKLELRRERVEVATIIRHAVEICAPLAESAGQTVQVELPDQPIYLDADPVRLSQVVCNLLNNASKFTGYRGLISLTVSHRDGDVVVAVKDTGIGIPPPMLNTIFDMFSQVNQSLERPQNGLGIGLTLARRLVELHGGTITAFSEGLGAGSEFVIRLPLAIDQASPPIRLVSEVKSNSGRRILIVDDNIDSATSLAEVLTLAGNKTFIAHDGEAAINAAAQYRPEVILLDIGLPVLNGFDACRRIRANSWAANIMIIALTGWGQEEDRRKSREAGFDQHLVKPVDLTALTALLDNSKCHATVES